MIIATAGHVDHGKTLLVKALTGIDTDRLALEKERGLTIDLGFAYELHEDHTLGFVDVPGHIKFISNMLAGVSAIDLALLVIAADDGPMPQTIEHLAILDLLGIENGVVALTKTDRVEPRRLTEVRQSILELLHGTFLAGAEIFPLSAVTGDGVDTLKHHLLDLAGKIEPAQNNGNFRLAIDRSFTIKGAGQVVTGSVFAGQVALGDELILAPHNIPVRVRGIHAQNQKSERGRTGERCAVNITGRDLNRVKRGNWLVGGGPPHATDRFDARLTVLASESRSLKHWTPVHIHSAANHVIGHVAILESSIAPGSSGLVQLICNEQINLWHNDRLVLRDQSASRTIGGGLVVDPFSPRRGRARPERLKQLRAMEDPVIESSLERLLTLSPAALNLTRFQLSRNLLDAQTASLFDRVALIKISVSSHPGYVIGFAPSNWTRLKDQTIQALATWHKTNPGKLGPGESQLRHNLSPSPPAEAFDRMLAELLAAGKISKTGATLHLPDHAASMTDAENSLWSKLSPILDQSGKKPPVVHDLAKTLHMQVKDIERSLKEFIRHGLLVRVVKNRYFLVATVRELGLDVVALVDKSEYKEFTASEYRDRTAVGRNLAIEILEYFDRIGFTRRIGDKRIVAKDIDEVF